MSDPCRLCHTPSPSVIADFGHTPIAHRMRHSVDEVEETFPFVLTECPVCGFVQIDEPIPPAILYSGFNFNFSSWKTEPHIQDEVAIIGRRANLDLVVEVGSNDGRFLNLIRQLGAERVLGIEPNPVSCERATVCGISTINRMLCESLAADIVAQHGQASLVITRQVMEHVLDPHEFLRSINKMLMVGGYLFLDLPDSTPSFRIGDCSFLWEEHVGYYTIPLLKRLLAAHGFEVEETTTYDFSGGCIALLARKVVPSNCATLPTSQSAEVMASGFGQRVADYGARLKSLLFAARTKGLRTVLYGVGVRGCSATNFLKLATLLDHVVDDQPERRSLFMPGTRLPIESFADVLKRPGDVVVLLAVNNENDAKVAAKIRDTAGDRAHILTLCGPTDIHAELKRVALSIGVDGVDG